MKVEMRSRIRRDIFELLVPQLTPEQCQAAWKAANEDGKGIVWWKIGEGKSRIAITWTFMMGSNPKPLIVCSPGAFRQWRDEIILLGLKGLIKPKFLSCGALSQKYSTPVLDELDFNCVIVDELWMYKNPDSQRSRLIRQITSQMPSIGLSGNMMTAGNLEDLYGQARAMNLEKKIAGSMTSFRTQFMINTTNWAGFIERYPRKGAIEAIQRRLIDNIDIYFPKETKEIRDIEVNVTPTEEQDKLRKQLIKTYYHAEDNFELEIKSGASLLVKLQQLSDGFLRDKQGNYIFIKSSKMLRLKELCNELLNAGERLLIWVAFRRTANILSKMLPYKTTILSGDGKFDIFGWRNKKIKITIATVGSGASLNDFADVQYSIFYSTSFSSLNVQQSKGRTNRKSSLHNCCYYYFLATNKFPDRQIYQMIEENKGKEDIVKAVSKRVLTEYVENEKS